MVGKFSYILGGREGGKITMYETRSFPPGEIVFLIRRAPVGCEAWREVLIYLVPALRRERGQKRRGKKWYIHRAGDRWTHRCGRIFGLFAEKHSC